MSSVSRVFLRRRDIVHAIRSLLRAPWYAATVIGVIAIGMALSTTVFAIIDGALFKPLPYTDANRLFAPALSWSRLHDPTRTVTDVSPSLLHAWAAAVPGVRLTVLNRSDEPVGRYDRVLAGHIDAAFFDVVGLRPMLGGFTPQDFQAVQTIKPAVVTYKFWQQRLGGDASALGRVMTNETGVGIRIVGVLPADFVFPLRQEPAVLIPFVDVDPSSQTPYVKVLVRVGPSLSVSEASARLSAVTTAWVASVPVPPLSPGLSEQDRIRRTPPNRVDLVPIRNALTNDLAQRAWIVFAAAAALVLLACVNVSGLAVARVRQRWRDLVLRRSLGASYLDLVRLLAVEHAVLVVTGTGLGLIAAHFMLTFTLRLMDEQYLLSLKPVAIDLRVMTFSAVVAAASLALITLWSTWAAARSQLMRGLADGGGTTRRERAPVSILAIQVSLALVISVAGALVAGSLLRVWGEDPGFDIDRSVIVQLVSPKGASGAALEEFVTSLNYIPGVAHAGATPHPVMEALFNNNPFSRPPGVPDRPLIESVPITHGYLEAAGLQLVEGRRPTQAEFASGAPVMLVSRIVAARYWPGQGAVGQTLVNNARGDGRTFSVIGVVSDARYLALDREPWGVIYWPNAATPRPSIAYVLARFDSQHRLAVPALVTAITNRCPDCWILKAETFTDAAASTIRPRLFSAWLFAAFGVSALVIVGAGILGLVAMTTSRRTKEIAIRMALGATSGRVVVQLLREQSVAIAIGLLTGAVAAGWFVRFVATYLYKTPVYDLRSWAAAIGALLLVTAIGALIPSHGASRLDPVRAMRID